MYKKTIVQKIQPIENLHEFNNQKMIFQNKPAPTNIEQNGNENIFGSRTPRKREEHTPSSSVPINGCLTYHELNAKRDRIIQEQMQKMQQESQMMMQRYMDEANRRNDLLQNEINMRKLPRYKENLRIINNTDVYSYSTRVAEIKDDELHVFGWLSPTTSKHINYVADYYNLTKIN